MNITRVFYLQNLTFLRMAKFLVSILIVISENSWGIIGDGQVSPVDPISRSAVVIFNADTICSGIVLASKFVVSAAHCFVQARGRNAGKKVDRYFTLHFGNVLSYKSDQAHSRLVRPENILIHPDFVGFNHGGPFHDLAIIKLEQNIPVDVEPAELSSQPLRSGEEFTIAGFGSTWWRQLMRGLKPALYKVPEVQFQELSPDSGQMLLLLGRSHGQLIGGDSGGPVYTVNDGRILVTGIASIVATIDEKQLIGAESLATHSGWIENILNNN